MVDRTALDYCTHETYRRHLLHDIAAFYAEATAVIGHLVAVESSRTVEAEDRPPRRARRDQWHISEPGVRLQYVPGTYIRCVKRWRGGTPSRLLFH